MRFSHMENRETIIINIAYGVVTIIITTICHASLFVCFNVYFVHGSYTSTHVSPEKKKGHSVEEHIKKKKKTGGCTVIQHYVDNVPLFD